MEKVSSYELASPSDFFLFSPNQHLDESTALCLSLFFSLSPHVPHGLIKTEKPFIVPSLAQDAGIWGP